MSILILRWARIIGIEQLPILVSANLSEFLSIFMNLSKFILALCLMCCAKAACMAIYTAFHKYIPDGISGCRKKRSNNGTFF